MTDTLVGPSSVDPTSAASSVFDDPRGLRRAVVTATGVLVYLGCLGLLAVAGAVLYTDPHAPAAGPVGVGSTSGLR
ncbi:hypothetical protein [Kitasatospora sp. LaBMicrA B282]|uniref:hypothetical protein n=1 Tax=Kitasatospora sp. LaBMicrA B282 TaxID=3420949 RepID=UPI003D14107A